MEKRILIPNTDLSVYPIGLGAAGAGRHYDGADTDRLFATYMDLGGNLIDTAHVYSNWIPGERNRSERAIGDWFARTGKRHEIILMTKGGHHEVDRTSPLFRKRRLKREDMIEDVNGSLQKLRTDYIDIYFYHRDDTDLPVEYEIETMEQFVKEGKIRYYACSNWDADRMLSASEYCKEKGYRGFIADQSLLNIGMKYMKEMADTTLRTTSGDAYQFHIDHPEVMEMPFSSNCNGFFQRYLTEGAEAVADSDYYTEKNLLVAQRIKALTEKYNCTITQAVTGFFYFQPFRCIPLYGTSSPAHVKDVCSTLEIPFCAEDYRDILTV